MNKAILAKAWLEYRQKVVPKNAGQEQIDATKNAFYAGAITMMEVMSRVGEPDCPEEAGMIILDGIQREIKSHVQEQIRKCI